MRKWHIYECTIARLPPFGRVGVGSPSLSREGWGGSPVGVGLPSLGRGWGGVVF